MTGGGGRGCVPIVSEVIGSSHILGAFLLLWWWCRGTNCDQSLSMVQYCYTSTETVRLIRTENPGRPPWRSHSSWTQIVVVHSWHLWLFSPQSSVLSFSDFSIAWDSSVGRSIGVSDRRVRCIMGAGLILLRHRALFSPSAMVHTLLQCLYSPSVQLHAKHLKHRHKIII